MTEIRKQNDVAMRKGLLKARKSGELPKGIDMNDYTGYLSSIFAGLSIQAAQVDRADDPSPSGLLSLVIAHLRATG